MTNEPKINGEYTSFLHDLKVRIAQAQRGATLAVNRELIALYWQIGREIAARQAAFGWGTGVIDRLARDLALESPGVEGLSARNLRRMRAFYLAYAEAELSIPILPQPVAILEIGPCEGEPSASDSLIRRLPIVNLPWGHNIVLVEKIKERALRLWYAAQSVEHGWSRTVLIHQINSRLHERQGAAQTNFAAQLPPVQSELAQQMTKDPYVFDFLSLTGAALERNLERGLIENIRNLLLELGKGFAFIGSQYHLDVGNRDFYLDLLFYHTRLHCYVVVDLKTDEFKPEYAGKMNFYLSAVDDLVKSAEDGPSIGMIICQSRDKTIVEYSLRDTSKPMGVAGYRLTTQLEDALSNYFPSSEELAEREAILFPPEQP